MLRFIQLWPSIVFAVAGATSSVVATPGGAGTPDRILVPAGEYAPLLRGEGQPARVVVPPFWLDRLPVTNGDFLAFVEANPRWRRSQVGRLFADASYLQHWESDLVPGRRAPLDAPVVRVSWFAARAYARWRGLRLPTTAEWERAAMVGYAGPDGRTEPDFLSDLYGWLAKPTPEVQPSIRAAKANCLGVSGLHGLVWEWVDDFATAMVTGESRADTEMDRDLFCGAGAAGAQNTTDYAAFMRMALRSSLRGNNTTSSLGFRCAADEAQSIASTPLPLPKL